MQLLRSGTSVGANYRISLYGAFPSGFRIQNGIGCEKADESAYWIELLVDTGQAVPRKSRR